MSMTSREEIADQLKADEERKRIELVKQDNSKDSMRLKQHDERKALLKTQVEARGGDFEAELQHTKETLTALHKDGKLQFNRPEI